MATLRSASGATQALPRASTRRSTRVRSLKNFLVAMLFLSPSLAIFLYFVFIPLIKTFQLSLFYTNPLGQMGSFAGFDNYQTIFTGPDLLNGLRVSLLFALYVVPTVIALALLLAVLANVQLRGITIFRAIFSSTIAVAGAVASVIFMFLFNPVSGVFTYLLDLAHLPRIPWLVSPDTALMSVSLVTVWLGLGFNTIIILAALQGIPQELYESAKIDGAGFWASFRHVTIPMISPTLFFLVVVQTLNTLQAFAQINVLTRGGPANSTNAMVYLIYRTFFFYGQYGTAAALSIILFLVMLVLTVLQFGVLERRVHYA